MKIKTQVLVEAIVVGITLAMSMYLTNLLWSPKTTAETVILSFIVGFGIHILFEVSGLNAMYCTSGAACSK